MNTKSAANELAKRVSSLNKQISSVRRYNIERRGRFSRMHDFLYVVSGVVRCGLSKSDST